MRIYLAGELFSLKHLAGNVLLYQALQRVCPDSFEFVLPQDLEQRELDAVAIRNQDLAELLSSDVALFQFDGAEIDSGTIVEFIVAKMLDIPAVVLRTDFRRGGDNDEAPWNLMLTGYPRCVTHVIDGIGLYKEQMQSERSLEGLHELLATNLRDALQEAFSLPEILDSEQRAQQITLAKRLLGI